MTIDRNALASDLESLDLKGVASGVRNGTISEKRALSAVKRAYESSRFIGYAERAKLAEEILDRYRGEGTA